METLKILELFDDLSIKVGSKGNVYSLDHTKLRSNGRIDNRAGKKLKPKINRYGYEVVTLSTNGKRKSYTVHRLVALAFIPNPENKPTVNHKDGNKRNNHVSNLEWATHKEQKLHAIANGLCEKNILALKMANERRRINA